MVKANHLSRTGSGLLLSAAGLACAAELLWRAGRGAVATAASGAATYEDAVAAAAAVLAAACLGWLSLGLALVVAETLPGALGRRCARLAARLTPAAGRRIARLVLGLAVTTVPLTAPTQAFAESPAGPAVPAVTAAAAPLASMTSVPLLDRPTAASAAVPEAPGAAWTPAAPARVRPSAAAMATALVAPPARADRAGTGPGTVVVRRGDTLWDIAARHAGPSASAADVARAWPRWWAANRHVIGDDPDLLLPGTLLRSPA